MKTKFLSTLSLLLIVFTLGVTGAYAAETEEDFTYESSGDTVTITKYTGGGYLRNHSGDARR